MTDGRDRSTHPLDLHSDLRYSIRSARAVVEALIARDSNAAEEAALRTCRDCDLLIRLIRELALLLRDPLNQRLGLDPVMTAALVRRADRVLALVDALPSPNLPSATSDHDHDGETVLAHQPCDARSGSQTLDAELLSAPHDVPGLTVASVGLRVRLVPYEIYGSTNPLAEERKDSASAPAVDKAPPDASSD
ncbi:hypothetical protein [Microvirga splendida]|uniref:Histidine kinase n=1 Tax=Microvirga splendida TaxID=2795727 RepID=A0ABS0Y2Q6_9HYPH|nr:hypothetical protein [Microvirga splendida]MBJ6126300.1 hypothetical protein [Microvirga splendida]